jgi:hypothetical protein
MLGQKEQVCKVHPAQSLENLVPQNHFYRQVEARTDLSFVRELVAERYAGKTGGDG